jgi:hypothetical protein
MDVVGGLAPAVREADPELSGILEGILADEIQHVRFANRWLRRYVEQDRRTLLKLASAVRFLSQANAALQARPGETNAVGQALGDPAERVPAVNVQDRRLAEFSDEEIAEILRQAGFRALLRDAPGDAAP